MNAWQRMWSKTALFLVALLVSSQALAAAQLCWPAAHGKVSAASAVLQGAASHLDDPCPGASPAGEKSTATEALLLPGQRLPLAPVLHTATLSSALGETPVCAGLARVLRLPILFGNLRL